MKNYFRFLVVFSGLAALTAAARGQAVDQLIVQIPYDFVAAGTTLPAGNYKVARISDSNEHELVISSFENHVAILVHSSVVDTARAGRPGVTFQQIGDQHFLSRIETGDHVFTFPVSSSAAWQVALRKQSAPSGSGSSSSGNN